MTASVQPSTTRSKRRGGSEDVLGYLEQTPPQYFLRVIVTTAFPNRSAFVLGNGLGFAERRSILPTAKDCGSVRTGRQNL
jgi:hypothetical protein